MNSSKATHGYPDPTVLFQTYTLEMLAPVDGKHGGRIFLAINGIVFEANAYYGPGAHALQFFWG